MRLTDDFVAEVVQRVLAVSTPIRIVLFGSAATGAMTPDSDIDLLIIEEEPGDVREAGRRIRAALRGLGHPFDIIVMARERFEETRHVIGGIAYPANKYGRVVYEAA
jgi:predicted nucleotidyltransferase